MSQGRRLDLMVLQVAALTPAIRALTLAASDGATLPGWEAGAHVKVELPGGGERSYSLVNHAALVQATAAPASYLLGVRRDDVGRGGSRHMHDLRVGDAVSVSMPVNQFPLVNTDRPIVLVAGGIGVTPILSMTAALQAREHPYRVIYAARDPAQFAFRDEIEALAGPALTLHADDRHGVFDLPRLMATLVQDEPLYLCGPLPMIEAGRAAAAALGWAPDRLHFEIFGAPAALVGEAAFEVVLYGSGRSYTITPDKSILDVLIEAGEDPMHDCRRGDCGICQVGVIEGVPDHRDYILSDSERAAGKLMQICVSRSKTPRLVLDL